LLQQDTLLDATIDFDVFAKKNQKVTLSAKLVRNQVSNGFNVTGYISAKGRVSEQWCNGLLKKFFLTTYRKCRSVLDCLLIQNLLETLIKFSRI
jgi:hypothetical protein